MNLSTEEKKFFLDIFRGKTLCLSLVSGVTPRGMASLGECLGELIAAEIRAVLFVRPDHALTLADDFRRHTRFHHWHPIEYSDHPSLPAALWRSPSGIYPIIFPAAGQTDFLDQIVHLALSWRISRMIFLEERGGLMDAHGKMINFVNFAKLSEYTSQSATTNDHFHKKLLKSIDTLLSHGVGAIGLCRPEDLHLELFTYEGGGTYFSCHHYCEVRPLSWDEFPQVASLIHQGVREGFLLPRSDEQISKILLNGFGAFLSGQHLAGICALFTEGYEADNAAEVVSLYALTRYQGEGIGVRLVQELKSEAKKLRLERLFACTLQPRVMDFFRRQGFKDADTADLPVAKWRHYDPERRQRVHCFIFDIQGE
ncbi:MAG: GNAT family N-acetyltransferase [Magnetococcales bacterium]|nr:GNAT family N-acetyltransferase [Magnetococcales bacterium]